MSNIWFPRMILDLTVAAVVSFALAMLIPLSVWQSVGTLATSLAILSFAAVVTGVFILRRRGSFIRAPLGEPVQMTAE